MATEELQFYISKGMLKKLEGCRVVIFGAGACGKDYYRQIRDRNNVHLVEWIDNYVNEALGHSVGDVKSIVSLNYDVIIIAVSMQEVAEEIMQQLMHMGVPENKILWEDSRFATLEHRLYPSQSGINKVILFGGENCENIFFRFKNSNTYVVCIASILSDALNICGVPVFRPSILNEPCLLPYKIVLTVRKENQRNVRKVLSEEYHVSPERIITDRLWYPTLLEDQRVVVQESIRYEVHLAEHCNLNCRGCAHFSSIASEIFLNVDSYRQDCIRLGELYNHKAELIHLCGGEPLLHPRVIEIIEITRKSFPIGLIRLITNGLLLKNMSEEFWRALSDNKINLEVTKYPIGLDYEWIEEKAATEKVLLEWFAGSDQHDKDKYFGIHPIDIYGRQDINKSFDSCPWQRCIQLSGGKLYACGIPPYISHLAQYFGINIPNLKQSEGIDIFKAKDANEISRFLYKPMNACRYCDVTHIKQEKWCRTKKAKEEWIYVDKTGTAVIASD